MGEPLQKAVIFLRSSLACASSGAFSGKEPTTHDLSRAFSAHSRTLLRAASNWAANG